MLYANPPWSLIAQVLAKTRRDGSTLLLVTPQYQQIAWQAVLDTGTLRKLVWDKPLYLDAQKNLRTKPKWDTVYQGKGGYRLKEGTAKAHNPPSG